MIYNLLKNESLDNTLNIVFEGKTIGIVINFESNSYRYSKVLKSKASSFEYIQIFKEYRKKGHCLNFVKELIGVSSCDYFVVQKPVNIAFWKKVAEKIKEDKSIKDYTIEKIIRRKEYDIREDLVLIK